MKHTTAVIDLNNVLYASYHSTAKYMKDKPISHQVNEVISTTIQTISIAAEETKASRIICASDAGGRPAFRIEASAGDYKSNRGSTPEVISNVHKVIDSILSTFNIMTLNVDGYEADDIYAGLAKYFGATGTSRVFGVSRDDDWTLAVAKAGGNTALYNQMTKKQLHYYQIKENVDAVMEYDCPPEMVFKFSLLKKAICGDSSDNISGFTGIGGNRASKLAQAIVAGQYHMPVTTKNKAFLRKTEANHQNFYDRVDLNRLLMDPYSLPISPVVKAYENYEHVKTGLTEDEIIKELKNKSLAKSFARFSRSNARHDIVESGGFDDLPEELKELFK